MSTIERVFWWPIKAWCFAWELVFFFPVFWTSEFVAWLKKTETTRIALALLAFIAAALCITMSGCALIGYLANGQTGPGG